MSKVSEYASATVLNEGMFFYIAIDTDTDGIYESRKASLATVRTSMYDTNSRLFKESKGSDIASAAALTIGTDGNYFDVTGSVGITSINTVKVGTEAVLHFDGTPTLTHSATDLILPGGQNIVAQAGDHAIFREYDTGLWRCIFYSRASQPPMSTGFIAPVFINAVPQTLSGPGAVDIISPITNFTSTGASDALTLADSTILGQIKVLNHEVDGGGYVLTPTTFANGTDLTVTDAGVSVTLMWTASGWTLVSQTGVAVIA